jgi:hypothetical protein
MAIHTRSQEAEAAQRFFEASRNVDLAFRALRTESDEVASSLAYGAAQSRLDHALDELAHAQALFDSVTSLQPIGGKNHQEH